MSIKAKILKGFIELGNYSEYGYHVGIGEETNKPLLEATPMINKTFAKYVRDLMAVSETLIKLGTCQF